MKIVEIFPKICKAFPHLVDNFIYIGMVPVAFYHMFCGNTFINTSFEEAHGLEKVANVFLMPTQYLCEGKQVHYDPTTNQITLKQRFQYRTGKKFYTPLALTFFTPGIILGTTCKKIAFLSPEVSCRHKKLQKYVHSKKITSHLDEYRALGIDVTPWTEGEKVTPLGIKRRPGDENNLKADKEALKEIVSLLTKAKILFWVDCGTCIGAYRHGGVLPTDNDIDISVLVNDFQNVWNALKELDSKKFVAQDWSGRGLPQTLIRVYIKETRNHLDVYHYNIQPEEKTISYIVSNKDSQFMSEDWKKRELKQSDPLPYDAIFPLKRIDFDGIEVPIPNQPPRYIALKNYGDIARPPWIYSEKTGKYEKDLTHPYWDIPLAH